MVRSGVKTLWLVATLGFAGAASAAERPVVVELFTSQSCYSCPPAEAYLGELASRPGLIALEFHVDYWNQLVYGSAGRWADVHSSPAHTERQRGYAARLPGGVYTPQMVVDGRAQAVGSRTRDVDQAIAAARTLRDPRPEIAATRTDDGLAVRIAGLDPVRPVPVWLARYKLKEITRVAAGENRGKTLANHHVVTSLEAVGIWTGGEALLTLTATLAPGEGCAILIQDPAHGSGLGPILAAAACP